MVIWYFKNLEESKTITEESEDMYKSKEFEEFWNTKKSKIDMSLLQQEGLESITSDSQAD